MHDSWHPHHRPRRSLRSQPLKLIFVLLAFIAAVPVAQAADKRGNEVTLTSPMAHAADPVAAGPVAHAADPVAAGPVAHTADPVAVVVGPISSDSVIEADRIVAAHLEILPGIELTLKSREISLIGDVLVNGTLKIKPLGDDAVSLAGASTIVVNSAASLSVENAIASSINWRLHGSATFTNFASHRGAVSVLGGALTGDLDIIDSPSVGLLLRNATFAGEVRVDSAASFGIDAEDSTVDIFDVAISHAADYGVRAVRTDLRIDQGSINGHCGVYLALGSTGVIEALDINATQRGVSAISAVSLTLSRSTISGDQFGIALESTPSVIQGVTIANSGIGLQSFDSTGLITAKFINSENADLVLNGDLPTLRNSWFAGSAEYAIRNQSLNTLDARENFVDSQAGIVQGSVDASQPLHAPPAWAL